MRVLLVNTSDAGGGAQEIGARIMRDLRDDGHEVRLAVGHRQTDDPAVEVIPNFRERSPIARGAAHLGHVTRRQWIARAGEPLRTARVRRGYEDFDFPGTWKLLETEPKPDVIHAHNLHGGYFDLRALPELSRMAPLVLTLQDMWTMTGHVAHPFDCERWRTGCGECPYLGAYPALPRDRTAANWQRKRDIYSRSRYFVATPSRWLHDRLEASILMEGLVESRVINAGVDLDLFSPGDKLAARRRVGLPEGKLVVLFAANSTKSNEFKDFATLQRALESLSHREMVAVSVGEAGATRRVGQAEMRMAPRESDPAVMAEWYRAADVYVHPARADTFPTTVLEAMAAGLPVVGSAVGGIPEQIDDGVTGNLVPPGDPRALAEAIDALLADGELRERFAAAAHDRAVARFDVRRMVADYVDFYERALSLSSSSPASSRMRSA